jgi:hypothetical protein
VASDAPENPALCEQIVIAMINAERKENNAYVSRQDPVSPASPKRLACFVALNPF